MNYKYKFFDDTFILSPDEHLQVNESLRNGRSIISLRKGKLMLNMSHIVSVSETDSPVDELPSQTYLPEPKPKMSREQIGNRLTEMKKVLWKKWGLE